MNPFNGQTPTQRKSRSPFAINRKSQMGTISSTPTKQNQKSFSNRLMRLENKCTLAMSRPVIEFDGQLVDPQAQIRDRDNTILNYKDLTKKLQFQIRRKDNSLTDLQNLLIQKQEQVNRLQKQNYQYSNLNNNPTTLITPSELHRLKIDLSQKSNELFQAKTEIQKLKQDLIILQNSKNYQKQQSLLNSKPKSIQQNKALDMLKGIVKTLKSGGSINYKQIQKLTGVII